MRTGCTRAVLFALGIATAACGGSGGPNVVLVSIDTLRADHLGCYGYPRPTSPNLDRFATQGVRFAHALAPSPWTVPSHASLLTGLLPARHGMLDFDRTLSERIPTLAERLQAAGYETAAFFNIHYFRPPSGLHRGFGHLVQFRNWDTRRRQLRSAPAAIEQLGAWLDERGDRPFFAFFHTFDVHSDYRPGQAYREAWLQPYQGSFDGRSVTLNRVRQGFLEPSDADIAHAVDLYDAGLRQLDDDLGALFELLDRAGVFDDTYVVITSDHGEEFFEHGSVLHGRTLYQEVLSVPLLVRGPGVPAGRVVETPVQLVDLVPTLLDLLGREVPADLDGIPLAPLWSDPGAVAAPPRSSFAEAAPWKLWVGSDTHLVSVSDGRLKLIHDLASGRSQLFDLESDPAETNDLAADRPERVAELKSEIVAYLERRGPESGAAELAPEQIEALRSLGYVK